MLYIGRLEATSRDLRQGSNLVVIGGVREAIRSSSFHITSQTGNHSNHITGGACLGPGADLHQVPAHGLGIALGKTSTMTRPFPSFMHDPRHKFDISDRAIATLAPPDG